MTPLLTRHDTYNFYLWSWCKTLLGKDPPGHSAPPHSPWSGYCRQDGKGRGRMGPWSFRRNIYNNLWHELKLKLIENLIISKGTDMLTTNIQQYKIIILNIFKNHHHILVVVTKCHGQSSVNHPNVCTQVIGILFNS